MKKYAALIMMVVAVETVFGGSLNPPAPPIAGTMKPLDQVEPRTPISSVPFTISQGGSYYLTKDMSCAQTAITVSVDNVTIDLCGFTLTGTGTTGIGIDISMRNNVEIRNGTITCFPGAGIRDFSPNAGDGHRIIGIRAISNGTYGIALAGRGHTVKDCTVQGTLPGFDTWHGIITGGCSIISDCSVSEIGTSSSASVYGIKASSSTVTGCTVCTIGKSASGQVCGIGLSTGGTVSDNTVYGNGQSSTGSNVWGINVGPAVTVTGNSVYSNGLAASGNRYGIYAWSYCLVDRNTSYDNGINLMCVANSVSGTNCAP